MCAYMRIYTLSMLAAIHLPFLFSLTVQHLPTFTFLCSPKYTCEKFLILHFCPISDIQNVLTFLAYHLFRLISVSSRLRHARRIFCCGREYLLVASRPGWSCDWSCGVATCAATALPTALRSKASEKAVTGTYL
jgi:hypothetical protein